MEKLIYPFVIAGLVFWIFRQCRSHMAKKRDVEFNLKQVRGDIDG